MNTGSQAVGIQLRNLSEQCALQPKMTACSSKSMAYVQLLLYLFGYITSDEKQGGFNDDFGTAVYSIHGNEHREDYTANRLVTLPRIIDGSVTENVDFKDSNQMATMRHMKYDLRHGPDSVSFQRVTMFKNSNAPFPNQGLEIAEVASTRSRGKINQIHKTGRGQTSFPATDIVELPLMTTEPLYSQRKSAKLNDFLNFAAKSRADTFDDYTSFPPDAKNSRGPCMRRPFKYWITHTKNRRSIRKKRELELQPANTLSSKMKFLLSHHLNKSSIIVETPNAENAGNSTTGTEESDNDTDIDETDDTNPSDVESTTDQQDRSLEAYRQSQDDNIRDIIENINNEDSTTTTETTTTTTEMTALEKLKHLKKESNENDPLYKEKKEIEKIQKRRKLHNNLLIGRGTKKYTTPAPNEGNDYSYSYHKPIDIQKVQPVTMHPPTVKPDSTEANEEDEGQNTNVQEEVLGDNEQDQGNDERSQETNDDQNKQTNIKRPYVTYDQVLRVRDRVPQQYAIHEPENEGEQNDDQRETSYHREPENEGEQNGDQRETSYNREPENGDQGGTSYHREPENIGEQNGDQRGTSYHGESENDGEQNGDQIETPNQKYEESPVNTDDSADRSTADDPTDPFPKYDPIEHKFNAPGDFEEHEKKINTINFIQKHPDTDNEQNNENNEDAEGETAGNDEQAEDASVEEQQADPEENDVEQQIQQFDQMFDDDHKREDERAAEEENDESEEAPEQETEEQVEEDVTDPEEGEEEKEEVEEQGSETSEPDAENDPEEDNGAEVEAENNSNPQNQQEEQTTLGYGYGSHHPTHEYIPDYDTGSERPFSSSHGLNYPVQYVNPTYSPGFKSYPNYYLTPPNRPSSYVPPLDYSAIYNSFPKSKNNVEFYKLPNIYQKHEYTLPPKRHNVPNHRPDYTYNDDYGDGITMESSQEETKILSPIPLKSSEEHMNTEGPNSIEFSGENIKNSKPGVVTTSGEEYSNLLSSSSISSEEQTTFVDPKTKFSLGSPSTDFPKVRKPKKDTKSKKPIMDESSHAFNNGKEKKTRIKSKKQFRNTTQKPNFNLVKYFIEQEDKKTAGHSAFYRPDKKKANIFQVGDTPILKQFHSLFDSLATGTNHQINKNIHHHRNITTENSISDHSNSTKKVEATYKLDKAKIIGQKPTKKVEAIFKEDKAKSTGQNATHDDQKLSSTKDTKMPDMLVKSPLINATVNNTIDQRLKSDVKNKTSDQKPKVRGKIASLIQKLKSERKNITFGQKSKSTNETIKPYQAPKEKKVNTPLDQKLTEQMANSTFDPMRSSNLPSTVSESYPANVTTDTKKVQSKVLEKLRRLGKVLGGNGSKNLIKTVTEDLKRGNESLSLNNTENESINSSDTQSMQTNQQIPQRNFTEEQLKTDSRNELKENDTVLRENSTAVQLSDLMKNVTGNRKEISDETNKNTMQSEVHQNHELKDDINDAQHYAANGGSKNQPQNMTGNGVIRFQKSDTNSQSNGNMIGEKQDKLEELMNNANKGTHFDLNDTTMDDKNDHESNKTEDLLKKFTDILQNGADDQTNQTGDKIEDSKKYQSLDLEDEELRKNSNQTDTLEAPLSKNSDDRSDNVTIDQLDTSFGDQMEKTTDQQMAGTDDQSVLFYTKPGNCDLTTGWCGLETYNSTVTHKVGVWPFRKTYFQQDDTHNSKDTQIEQFLQKIRLQGEEYDFIIIGAGSAGCVLANRLSEIRHWRVLLLEAGTEEPFFADIPALAPLLQGSSIDWGFLHEPSNRSCKGRPMGRCGWAQGKVMGGSSTINFMMYTRGNAADYDEWAHLGNSGWSYHDVLPYFRKAEDNRNPDVYNANPEFHGVGGYQPVERLPEADENVARLIQMWREMGLEERDLQAERQIGVMHVQTTTKNGERMSTNRAYIRPIRQSRPNLIIRTQAMVTRILVGREKGGAVRAIGVEYTMQNKQMVSIAKKEVILSAGAINSPKLLMLSGIGPGEHLQRMNINVVKDLRVGENLQDHVTTDGVIVGLPKTSTQVSWKKKKSDVLRYQKTRRGPLASTGAIQATVFVNTDCNSYSEVPDIQYSYDAADLSDFLFSPEMMSAMRRDPLGYYDAMSIRPVLMKPKSRGRVLLNETDPFKSPPLIYSGYFTQQEDVDVMVAGIKLAIEAIETTKTMQEIDASMIAIPLAGCEMHEWGSDEYWACHIMAYTATIFHPAGTCKMGPVGDTSAVVDPRLRVHGVKSLRVIDSSIMPKIARGNTNSVTIMIAEKGSDMIKEDWARKHS